MLKVRLESTSWCWRWALANQLSSFAHFCLAWVWLELADNWRLLTTKNDIILPIISPTNPDTKIIFVLFIPYETGNDFYKSFPCLVMLFINLDQTAIVTLSQQIELGCLVRDSHFNFTPPLKTCKLLIHIWKLHALQSFSDGGKIRNWNSHRARDIHRFFFTRYLRSDKTLCIVGIV